MAGKAPSNMIFHRKTRYYTMALYKSFPKKLSMAYIVADEEVAEFEFGFGLSLKDEDKIEKVDVKKGPDRWRMGYQEVCLEGQKGLYD